MLQDLNSPDLTTTRMGIDPVPAIGFGNGVLHEQAVCGYPNGSISTSSTEDADSAFTASLTAPEAYLDASMAPLLEMVDWDASFQTCWDYYQNEQNPLLGWSAADDPIF